jgi:hypothetical protein
LRFEIAVAAGVVLALGAACVERQPLEPARGNTLVVHAVLDPSSRDQTVAVQIARGTEANIERVTGATVILALPDGRRMQAIADTGQALFGYHFPLDRLGFELVPGATYGLEIHVPDGRTVTGHTTIPRSAPVSLDAAEEEFFVRDTLRMRWSRVPAARGYEVSVLVVGDRFETLDSFFADTAVDLTTTSVGSTGNTLLSRGRTNHLAVTAVDTNYFDYYRRESDIFTGVGLITHLEGADGLFGSLVPIGARVLSVH